MFEVHFPTVLWIWSHGMGPIEGRCCKWARIFKETTPTRTTNLTASNIEFIFGEPEIGIILASGTAAMQNIQHFLLSCCQADGRSAAITMEHILFGHSWILNQMLNVWYAKHGHWWTERVPFCIRLKNLLIYFKRVSASTVTSTAYLCPNITFSYVCNIQLLAEAPHWRFPSHTSLPLPYDY